MIFLKKNINLSHDKQCKWCSLVEINEESTKIEGQNRVTFSAQSSLFFNLIMLQALKVN